MMRWYWQCTRCGSNFTFAAPPTAHSPLIANTCTRRTHIYGPHGLSAMARRAASWASASIANRGAAHLPAARVGTIKVPLHGPVTKGVNKGGSLPNTPYHVLHFCLWIARGTYRGCRGSGALPATSSATAAAASLCSVLAKGTAPEAELCPLTMLPQSKLSSTKYEYKCELSMIDYESIMD